MFSTTITVGRLTRDPELTYVGEGANRKAKTTFTIAWDHPYKKNNTQFTNVVVWNKHAESVAQYSKKGRVVMVEGVQTSSSWDKTINGETVKMHSTELEADKVKFIDSPNQQRDNSNQQPAWNSEAFGRTDGAQPQANPTVQPTVQPQFAPQNAPQNPQFQPQYPNQQPQYPNQNPQFAPPQGQPQFTTPQQNPQFQPQGQPNQQNPNQPPYGIESDDLPF